ncbi:MAG: exodeoxyribonuclease III [Geminicoccaceae bacterium]|nr:MAG: exodeoxyribonuclease III [Geminicoccaceae bacterium]
MRITTWNVNSVRLRLATLERIVRTLEPDVLCLQEIKVEDQLFPTDAVKALGFDHVLVHGQRNYHGVAILSKLPLDGHAQRNWCEVDHRRHQITHLPGGIELHNLYIPSGGDVPDRNVNPKFAHKLDFLAELATHWEAEAAADKRMIAVGDFNIAPLETDVWSHKQLLDVVSHTPIEVEALGRLQRSAGFVDAVRAVIPPEVKLYSWWSYRARDWSASDRGRRLDHVWVTPPLASAIRDASVLREARGWDKPSDHVPVTVDLDL